MDLESLSHRGAGSLTSVILGLFSHWLHARSLGSETLLSSDDVESLIFLVSLVPSDLLLGFIQATHGGWDS